jgi:hypothetical protein
MQYQSPDIAVVNTAMASKVLQTPPRRIRHDYVSPPSFNVYDKQGDATSSASESQNMKHQESGDPRSQSTPNLVERSPEKTTRSGLPIRHAGRRSSLINKRRSASDGTVRLRASISNDDSIHTPHLENNRFPSPCGKKFYSSPGRGKKHQDGCAVCKDIKLKEMPQVQTTSDTTLAMKRQAIAKPEETCVAKAVEEHLGETGGTLLSVNPEAPDDLESGRSRVPSHRGVEDDSDVVYVKTLNLEDESDPEGAPAANFAKSKINATELHSKVWAALERELTPRDSKGYIYILWDPKRPRLHKIGRTIETGRRKGDLQRQCGSNLTLINHPTTVNNHFRTEYLIHMYLSDLCRPYVCEACGRLHEEWFEISAKSAKTAVDLWVTFMDKEDPYDPETRQLRPFMEDLVKRRDRLLADADSKIETIRSHWDQILSPSSFDRFRFNFIVVWDLLWKYYWPINTMFAWTVAFVASRHAVTFLLMAASVVGTFISMSDERHRLRNPSKRSKRKSI